MKKRGIAIGVTAVVLAGALVVGAATTHAAGAFGRLTGPEKERVFRAILDAKLDIVAGRLGLSDRQREQVDGVCDELIAQFKANRAERMKARQEFLEEFRKDDFSRATLEGMADERHRDAHGMRDTVIDAILDLHQILTPEQRDRLGDLIAERHGHFGID